jgi:hypothetical protein
MSKRVRMYAREHELFAAVDPRTMPRTRFLPPLCSLSMASSSPPNGSSSANAIRAHGRANGVVQKDAKIQREM